MKSKTFKKLTALLVAVMLVLSMCVSGISAFAAAVSDGTTVVYLKPNSNWTMDNARFAVYLFYGTTNTWADMTDEDDDGYYEVTLPEGNWSKIIFCRMNPNTTANNWDNKWNQTSDLDIADGMNCYTVADGAWDKGSGTWSLYNPSNPSTEVTTAPTVTTTQPVISGNPDSYYLFGYINGANYACEEDADNAGEYEFVDGQVTATFEINSYVAVKKGDNSAWYMTDGWLGQVTEATLYNTNNLSTTADKLYVPAGQELTFTLVDNGDDTLTLSYTTGDSEETTVEIEPTEETIETTVEIGPTEETTETTVEIGPTEETTETTVETEPTEETTETTVETEPTEETTVPAAEPIYVVAGAPEICGPGSTGYGWDMTVTENIMTKSGDVYTKTFTSVEPANRVALKVVEIDSDQEAYWYGCPDGSNVTFNITQTCDVTVTFNPATKEITVTGDGVVMVTDLDVEAMRTVGNGDGNWLNDSLWDPAEDLNIMTEISDGIYQITYSELAKSDKYEFKFTANGSWTDNWGGTFESSGITSEAVYDSANIVFEVPYELADVTITLDITNFNYSTKKGATFKIDIIDVTPEEPVATLNFIIPKTTNNSKSWDNGIYLAYSDDYTLASFTKLALTKTDQYSSAEVKTDNLVSGTYSVYSISLTESQAEAIDNAPYVALMNSSSTYRTYVNIKYNLLKAPVNATTDTYNSTKATVASLDGYTFIMNNEVQLGSSIQGYGTFTGYWNNGNVSTEQTIQVVLPASSKWKNCWNQGVYLAYSDDYAIDSFTKIEMTKTETYVEVESQTDQLVSGSYAVYTVTLANWQAAAIENAKYVVFMNASGTYRTYVNSNYNILKAGNKYADSYGSTKSSVASHKDDIFVVCGGIATGTSIEGYGTFSGYWMTLE